MIIPIIVAITITIIPSGSTNKGAEERIIRETGTTTKCMTGSRREMNEEQWKQQN